MKLKLFFLLIPFSFLLSCTKQGPAGPAGANGNANVTSQQFTVSSWSQQGNDYYTNLSVPSITNAGTDAVIVSVLDANTWATLPATNLYNAGDYMNVYISNGNVQIDYIFTAAPGNQTFKVEVIPPQ